MARGRGNSSSCWNLFISLEKDGCRDMSSEEKMGVSGCVGSQGVEIGCSCGRSDSGSSSLESNNVVGLVLADASRTGSAERISGEVSDW